MEQILAQKPKRKGLGGWEDDEEDVDRNYDPVVASAMEELQAKKRAKKEPGVFIKAKKGLTLGEVEEQEGGAVQESKIGMAATKRAEKRKLKAPKNETEMLAVDDMVVAEEDLEQEEDEGTKLEPFNLEQERQEGRFDESGNYVENKEEDDPTMQDPWLTSDDAKIVSEEVRRKVEAQNMKMDLAEDAPPITPLQAANLIREILEHLKPGENVNKALRRLRPQQLPSSKVSKRNPKSKEKSEEPSENRTSSEDKRKFDQITEAAMTLMDAGELDIYSIPREDLEEKAGQNPPEADDLDMFGEDNQSKSGQAKVNESLSAEPNSKAPQLQQTTNIKEVYQEPEVDYSTWPVKELARFLRERGIDPVGFVEKSDLVAKVSELASKGPEGEEVSKSSVPDGYVYDSASNYFFNAQTGLYYDQNSGSFFSSENGKWYNFDTVTGQYIELV